jgi:hypothetical protein
MVGDGMNEALEATLSILQSQVPETSFAELARGVIAQAHVDEATAKAAILRLNCEGQVEITFEWSVRLPHQQLQVVAA